MQGLFKEAVVTAVGSGALDPKNLERIARKSVFHRSLLGASTVNAVLTFTGFAAFAATIAGTLLIDTPLVGDSSKLIDASRYRLGTQRGQINFAKAIIRTNYYDRASWLIFGWISISIAVIGILSLSFIVYKFLKTRIPPSVVAHGEPIQFHSPQVIP